MIPTIALVAFKERQGEFIFVKVPNERGRYVRTDQSVIRAPCPHCHAVVGEPCKGRTGHYNGGTHHKRRSLAQLGRRIEAFDVVGIENEPDDETPCRPDAGVSPKE